MPQMNSLQQQHEAQVRRFAAEAEAAAAEAEALQRIAAEREAEASRHESDLGDLETKAASALAALEERFESEVEDVKLRQRATKLERQRLVSRLEGVEARMAGLELSKTAGAAPPTAKDPRRPTRSCPGSRGGGGSSLGATREEEGRGGRPRCAARGGEAWWIMSGSPSSRSRPTRCVGLRQRSGGHGGAGALLRHRLWWLWSVARVRAGARRGCSVRQLDERRSNWRICCTGAPCPAAAVAVPVELRQRRRAARQMMVLRNDLAFANNRLAELEDEREAMLRQFQNARDAAERLAIEARGAAEGGAAQYALAEGRVPQGEQDDITYRLAGAANKLSVELSRAPPPRPPPAPRSSVAAESSAGSEDFGALVESLEQQRVEIEAALVVEGDSFAAASEHVSAAEQRLESLQRSGGGAGGGEPSPDERAALVSAQRAPRYAATKPT